MHWRLLASGFAQHFAKLDGLLVRYEDLTGGKSDAIESYLGLPIPRDITTDLASDNLPLDAISAPELVELDRAVEPLASSLGYTAGQQEPDRSPVTSSARSTDPRRCVILVPVGGHIEPQCEHSLRILEQQGYQVRRVRGYAAIDQARNQMATDALRDGFEETMWIDSDVGFDPESIERLRSHRVPIVCGVYPQKGKRSLAIHVIPGTKNLRFGRTGGLVEILYAATGFLLVRREVYEQIQRDLELPLCNARFGKPVVPYFQPLVREDQGGHWYLAEDYAFCERARRCGHRILADTAVRLVHVGQYGYTWEDAGSTPRRFGDFTLHLSRTHDAAQPQQTQETKAWSDDRFREAWLRLRAAHAPSKTLVSPPSALTLAPLSTSIGELLERVVSVDTRLVLTLGEATASVVACIAAQVPAAKFIAVDSDSETRESAVPKQAVRSESAGVAGHLEYEDRVTILRMSPEAAVHELALFGVSPDLVYIGSAKDYGPLKADIQRVRQLFADATIVGDGWDWEGVQRAVNAVGSTYGNRLEIHGVGWAIV